jgi:translocation and assembly module TamB
LSSKPARDYARRRGKATKRALARLGYVVLGLFAAAGLALSAAFLVVSTDLGRGILVPRLLRMANDALAGRIELDAFHLLGGGGIELVGLRVMDPKQDVVLRVDRARLHVDLGRLRSKVLGFRVQLDGPVAVLKREEDGSLSISRAFVPAHPSPRREEKQPSPFDWTVRVSRLTLRGGSVRYVDENGRTGFQSERVDVDARAAYGPRGARLELSLRSAMVAPESAPLALEVAGSLRGTEIRVRQLRVAVGETALDLVGDADWVSLRGRAALLALSVNAGQLRDVAPKAPLAGDLTGTLYVESDGSEATAALDLAPKHGGGTAAASVALRLPPGALAAGADVRLARLDLSRVLRGAPPTSMTLDARGRAAGRDLATLRGALALTLAPSQVRTGRFGPAELRATADRGTVEVTQLEAALPGVAVHGRGRWRQGAEVVAQATVDGTDLASLRQDLEALLGRPLPVMAGALRLEAELSGTEAAPAATVRVTAPRLAGPGLALSGLALSGALAGSRSSPTAQLEGTVAQLLADGLDARALQLRARLQGRAGEVSVNGEVPGLGKDALALRASGELSPDDRVLALSALTVAWPGDRFELQGPARVSLEGPSVDRFVLAAGAQRIAVSGGISGEGRRRTLDARAQVEALDLGLLPQALFPAKLGLAGRLRADVTAKGALAEPRVTGRVEVAQGAAMGLDGLSATADLGYDGAKRRARVDLEARRAAGGDLHVSAELPASLARASRTAPIAASVVLRGVRVGETLRAAEVALPADLDGLASLEVHMGGTVGAPTLAGSAALDGARYGDLDALALALRLEHAGAQAKLVATLDHQAARAFDLEAAMPLDLALLLREPARVAGGLAGAPLAVTAGVPRLDLARLAGHMGMPGDLRGTVTARADLSGTARAPRGKVTADLGGGAFAGYRGVTAEIALSAGDRSTGIEGKAALEGEELAQLSAALALSVERLGDEAARESAPLEVRIDVPRADLRRAGTSVPVAGEIAGQVRMAGSLRGPRLSADVTGRRLEIGGHPLGDLAAKARVEGRALHADLHLAVTTGGTLDGALDAEADPGLPALRRGDLGRAPARATLVANQLDLAFLPAVAPGVVRSASGKLSADLVASGPLARMSPRGTVSLAGGKASVAEFGDWSDVGLQASLTDDVFRVDRLAARHGGGTLDFKAEAKGFSRADATADLTAELRSRALTVTRAGQDLATVDATATLTGKVSAQALEAVLTVPQARVKLPESTPRKIQPLDQRGDIVVATFGKKEKEPSTAAGAAAAGASRPYRAKVHVLVPNRFFVKGDKPVVDIELKADVTAEYEEGELALTGDAETLRGRVEPIGGRKFDVKRGRVHFTGEDYGTGVLEIQAVYDNPAAKVTVAVGGTIDKPDVKLSSEPPMDEGQIALLIATGRTELKAGTGGVGTFDAKETGKEAGVAALGAVSQQAFKDIIADKLPVDTVSLDSSQLRAGKYVTDKIYVGYTRNFSARPEQGENRDEARVEFQISPRWNFEVKYGSANTGGASLIWSKDY